MSLEEYIDVVFNKKRKRQETKRIQSYSYLKGTYKINNISFFCFDDKRYILVDGIKTLAYKHHDAKLKQRFCLNTIEINI